MVLGRIPKNKPGAILPGMSHLVLLYQTLPKLVDGVHLVALFLFNINVNKIKKK